MTPTCVDPSHYGGLLSPIDFAEERYGVDGLHLTQLVTEDGSACRTGMWLPG